jgi:NitT/TauT family transport system substrate-binding protein
MIDRTNRALILGAGLLASLAFASAADPVIAAPVTFGDLSIIGDAPFYIAQEKGYFAQQKVEAASVPLDSAAGALLPLSTNQLQAVAGGLSAGLFNAFARDLPIRIVFGNTRDMPGFSTDMLLLREDLRDHVTTIKDLRGKKIALNAKAGSLEYILGRVLQTERLGLADVDLTYLSWPNQGAALANRAIDVGAVSEPFGALYTERKLAFPFKRAADVLRNPFVQVSVVLFSKSWMDREPEQANAFAHAYVQGMRYYYEAMKGGPNRQDVIDILTRHTTIKDKALLDRIQWSYINPNGDLVLESLRDQIDWFAKQGELPQPVDLDKMVDRRYLDLVHEKLGRVPAD